MKTNLLACTLALFSTAALADVPEVVAESIAFTQDAATGRVTVSYRLTGSGIVTADIETNSTDGAWVSIGGRNCCDLIGAVNRFVTSADSTQTHSFTWQPKANWPGHEIAAGKCRAVLKVWTKTDPPDYVAVDISGTKEKLFFADAEHLPGGLGATNRVYMTEKLLMRRIPAANVSWMMGSRSTDRHREEYNETQRVVRLTKDYYMGTFKATKYQHFRICDPNTFNISKITAINPVTGMSYMTEPKTEVNYTQLRGNNWPTETEAAETYSSGNKAYTTIIRNWRTKSGVPGLDIPTEAQWEYACRAGSPASWSNGYDRPNNEPWIYDANVAEICWYNDSKKNVFPQIKADDVVPVGLLKPNDWGLYDMHGICWEFCRDWYVSGSLFGGTDPVGSPTSASDKFRVGRGGRSGYRMDYTRSASRMGFNSNYGNGNYRLMCPVDELFED